nr:200 kDa antigen p200 [Tanacetum cinerariifolium]
KTVEIKEKSGKNSETKVAGGKKKAADSGAKKRKITKIESSKQRTRQSTKKQQVEKKEKEQVNKRKRDEKAKKEEVKKKMVKIKGKKKVKDNDEDFVIEEPHAEEDDNKKCEPDFKSLRARTTVIPLYDATQSLSPKRKTKIRETGFASMLDFLFQKIRDKLPYFVLKNFDTEKMEVSLPTGSKIKITPKKYGKCWLIYETIEEKFESVLKEKRELEDMLKENMEMHELFYDDEKFELFVKNFKEEFTTDDAGHANHGDVHTNDAGNSGHVYVFAASETEKKSTDKEDKEKAKMEKNAEQKAAEKEVSYNNPKFSAINKHLLI